MHIYSVKFRRRNDPSGRTYHVTVHAKDADEARAKAAIRDPQFGHTVPIGGVKRRGEVVEPEQADPITAAKARDDLRDGVAHFDWHGHDITVEVV